MGAILLYDTICKMSTGRKHPADILLWKKEKYEKKESFPLMKNPLNEKKPNGLALIPFVIFIAIYMGAGVYYQVKGKEMAFYQFPSVTAMFLAVLAGPKLVVVPAAFNMTTGPAHWELLFRQRAVDGQCYTVGTSPARDTAAGYVAWGHSIVCDPWGTVVRQCDETPQTVVTTLDMERVEAVRQQLPILSARRTDVYELRRK